MGDLNAIFVEGGWFGSQLGGFGKSFELGRGNLICRSPQELVPATSYFVLFFLPQHISQAGTHARQICGLLEIARNGGSVGIFQIGVTFSSGRLGEAPRTG